MTERGLGVESGGSGRAAIVQDLLDEATISYLLERGREATYDGGDIIIRRGVQGRSLFVLLDGEVEARLEGQDGRHLSLARMGAGATFGELSILRRTPTTADVVAVTSVRVLEYPAEHLHTALAECTPLRNKVLQRLAGNLHDTTLSTWRHFQRAEALVSLARGDGAGTTMVAASARMRAITATIDSVAETTQTVLITGPPGSGKLLAARRIHQRSPRREGPLIVVDCDRLPAGSISALLVGSDPGDDASFQLGGDLGAIHLAHEGSLVLRKVDSLSREDQGVLDRLLELRASTDASAEVRVVATARSATADEPVLIEPLSDRFGTRIHIPALAQRPRDIVPIATELLRHTPTGTPYVLTEGAELALVSHRYQHRNVAELRDVIELAIHCTDTEQIEAEHIFAAPEAIDEPVGIAVGPSDPDRPIVRPQWLRAARHLTLAGFLAAIAVCMALPSSQAAINANSLVWTVWEPLVFASFLAIGAVWCTVCPISTLSRMVQRGRRSPLRAHSSDLVRYGPVLSLIGFFAIVASERIFRMTENPRGSAILLLVLLVAAATLALQYRRELWCRSLCPLGRLASVLAPAAPLYVGASRSICASTCTGHECFKGTSTIPGCTVFHHPQQLTEAHQCKLCLDCVQSCPHDSARPYVRPPLWGLLRLSQSTRPLVTFALGLFLLAPVLLAAQHGGWLATPAALLGAGGLAVIFAVLLGPRGFDDTQDVAATRAGLALALLGWGPLMAYQIGNVTLLAQASLRVAPESVLASVLPLDISLAVVFRCVVILVSGVVAAVALNQIRRRGRDGESGLRPIAWHCLRALALAYVAASLLLSIA